MTARPWAGIPVTELRCADGASVIVADHGAHVLSWTPASETESALYLSGNSAFAAGAAIRGGVPIIFPQFNQRGSLKKHGFARNSTWRRSFAGSEDGRALARYVLDEGDAAGCGWPHRFALEYEVAIRANQLQLTLRVNNTDSHAWSFHAALHTYFRISDIAQVAVQGLQGLRYLDQVGAETYRVEQEALLRFADETDRVYAGIAAPIRILDGERSIALCQTGFADAVVWNPGAAKAATIADIAPGGERHFVCVEAGAVLEPVTLEPGAQWQGQQMIDLLHGA